MYPDFLLFFFYMHPLRTRDSKQDPRVTLKAKNGGGDGSPADSDELNFQQISRNSARRAKQIRKNQHISGESRKQKRNTKKLTCFVVGRRFCRRKSFTSLEIMWVVGIALLVSPVVGVVLFGLNRKMEERNRRWKNEITGENKSWKMEAEGKERREKDLASMSNSGDGK